MLALSRISHAVRARLHVRSYRTNDHSPGPQLVSLLIQKYIPLKASCEEDITEISSNNLMTELSWTHMNEFTPRPILEIRQGVRQLTNTQLRITNYKDTAKIIVPDAKRAFKEDWARSMNTARMILGQPLVPYEEEDLNPQDQETRDRLHAVIQEMSHRRVIRQQMRENGEK